MKNIYYLTLVSIFGVVVSSVIPIRGTDVWYLQYLALFAAFFVGFSIVLWQFNRYISLFTLICLFSTLFVSGQNLSIKCPSTQAMFIVLQVYLGSLAIYAISKFTHIQKRNLLTAVFILAVLQGGYVIIQYFNLDPIFNYVKDISRDDTVGLVGSHNQLGLFYAMTAPLILSMCPYILFLSIFCIYCSTTSVAWVSMIVVSLWYLGKKGLILWLILFCVFSGLYFYKVDKVNMVKFQERRDLSLLAVKSVLNETILTEKKFYDKKTNELLSTKRKEFYCNRWFGYGLANYLLIMPYAQKGIIKHGQSHVYAHAHNDYVEVFFELGVVGLSVLILMIGDFFERYIKSRKTPIIKVCFLGIVAQMICALGIFTMQTAVSGMLFLIFYGIFLGETNGKASELV